MLTGTKIISEDDALIAMDILHARGIPVVVISSSELGDESTLIAFGSKLAKDGSKQRVKYRIPRLPATFTGTGDLFAALLLAWLSKTSCDIKLSLEMVIATMKKILRRTFEYATKRGLSPATLELKLVQSKKDIENPMSSIGDVV